MDDTANALGVEDLAILRLESPRIAGHTCKLLIIDASPGRGGLSADALREHVAARLAPLRRLTERLSDDASRPRWVPDTAFDIRRHVQAVRRARPATRAELFDIVAEHMATRLDRARPLWSMSVVDLEENRTAVIALLHHCMVDGASAVRALAHVLWDPMAPEPAPLPAAAPAAPVGLDLRGIVRRELMPKSSETPLDRHPSPQRRVAAVCVPLQALKRIGQRVEGGATVNDVLLCLVAGGLRRWLAHHAGAAQAIRVQVPVSLHDAHEASDQLGNHDSFMIVDAGTDEPTRRGACMPSRRRRAC